MAGRIQFHDPISFSDEPCYAMNRSYLEGEDAFALSIKLTNSFLKELRNNKEKYSGVSLIDIVNTQLRHIRIQQSSRVEERLKCQSSHVINQFRTKYKGGRKRYKYAKEIYHLALYESELYKFSENEEPLTQLDHENVEREICCEEIWCSIDNALIKDPIPPEFDSFNGRQQRRRLNKITERSMKALNFLEEYGLKPKVLKLASSGGKEHHVSYEPCQYSDLPPNGKENLRSIVTILDRFGVSEAAYHELTQVFKDLPRTHAVVNARSHMTSCVDIKRVINGAIVSFREELKKKIRKTCKNDSDLRNVTVHLSADGTRVSHIATFVIFSFQLVGIDKKHSALDLCTLAIVNCKEDYVSLKTSLSPLFEEINSVVEDGVVNVDGKRVLVQIVFCSDMKMILTVMGLGSATSVYSCPWCLVRRENRHDTSYPLDYYDSDDMKRSLHKHKQHADSLEYGVQRYPLLNIDVENYVVDELHLLLRVTDVMLKSLLEDANHRDEKQNSERTTQTHIQTFVQCIQSCGVSFKVWEDRDSKKLNWTSLSGDERKKLLGKLPNQLKGKLDPENEEITLRIWHLFREIYEDISSSTPSSAENIFQMSKIWVETFLSLDSSSKDSITPYIHCMMYHVPMMISKIGSLRPFSCQIVEKTNDDIKKIYQRKSNKWDPTMEVLKIRKRMEEHSGLSRIKRKYTKRNDKYWDEDLKEARQKKRAKLRAETEFASSLLPSDDVNAMSPSQLRDFLQRHGIATKITSKGKLLEKVRQLQK